MGSSKLGSIRNVVSSCNTCAFTGASLGESIPRWLKLVMGWAACILPFMHAVYGYVTKGLLLAGIIRLEFFDFSTWATVNVEYFILTDLLLFEPWFLIAGILFGLATLYYQSDIRGVMDQKSNIK